ncbi:hypothetical protein CGJ15_25225, partial [Vibrio parahaemolyticus]
GVRDSSCLFFASWGKRENPQSTVECCERRPFTRSKNKEGRKERMEERKKEGREEIKEKKQEQKD